ncbi:hypothetical protein [Virgisporangium aliadipatigenens]|nr:hypothetical protein [Virgisporangium aliadipatigenens]
MYSRKRWPALLVAAVLGAGPALAAGAANAAPSDPSVAFSGGSVLNMLVCRSEPSTGRLTVPADSRVSFVNRLGQRAALRVDGHTVANVGANQTVPVTFSRGPASVTMAFECDAGLVEEFKTATVAVSAPEPREAPAAAANARAAAPAPQAGSGGGQANAPAAGRGGGGGAARQQSAPTPAAEPAGEATPSAAVDPWAPASEVPAAGVASGAAGTDTETVALPPPGVDVGVPTAAPGAPVNGPSGLLAMVATVLTVGVGVAAVRSAFARRSSRIAFA